MEMNVDFVQPDPQTRFLMISEIKSDICKEKLYISNLLNEIGRLLYPQLLLEAVKTGDESTLAASLLANECIAGKEVTQTNSGVIITHIPENAVTDLCSGEFNRFYMRALAIQAIESGRSLTIYPVNHVDDTQPTGSTVDPHDVLDNLRLSGRAPAPLGIGSELTSGLTAKLL